MERRVHPRVNINYPVELETTHNSPKIPSNTGETVNLSEGGLCIAVDNPLPSLPAISSVTISPIKNNRIRAKVEFIWGSRDEDDKYLYGGRFVEIEEESAITLKKRIQEKRNIVVASYLPSKILTNREIVDQGLNINPAIFKRGLGAVERRVAAPDEGAADMMAEVGRTLLEKAGCTSSQVDYIICSTDVGDAVEPETATAVQAKLGATCPAFGVAMSCTGWTAGVSIALNYLKQGKQRILVLASSLVGSRTYFHNLEHRAIFGDGAGGILLEKHHIDKFLGVCLWTDGRNYSKIFIPHPWSKMPDDIPPEYKGSFYMAENQKVFFGVMDSYLLSFTRQILKVANVKQEDIDMFLLHYPSKPLFEHSLKLLNIPRSKTFERFAQYGNIATAEMPVLLDEATRTGFIKPGNLVFSLTYGAGFTAGGFVMRY